MRIQGKRHKKFKNGKTNIKVEDVLASFGITALGLDERKDNTEVEAGERLKGSKH